jgi:hypothetical protein
MILPGILVMSSNAYCYYLKAGYHNKLKFCLNIKYGVKFRKECCIFSTVIIEVGVRIFDLVHLIQHVYELQEFCEHGNELLGSINVQEILDQPTD